MKIAVKATEGFLRQPQGVAALLYGPDAGLARERGGRLIKKLLGENYDPMSVLELNESRLLEDSARLADELSSVSLLADKRVILVRDAGDKFTKLLEATETLMRDDVFMIVLAGELGPRSSLRLWFEKAEKAASIPCYHDEARDIGELMREQFNQAGKTANMEVIQYLISQLGNDRYVTRQEIDKIILYLGDENILHLSAAEQLVNYNREADQDEMINALVDKKLADFDKSLMKLVNEGAYPVSYLRGLSRYFQRLYALKLQTRHQPAEQIIASLKPKVFFKQVPILTRHVKQWELPAIAKALGLIQQAELVSKTSNIPVYAASQRELFKVTQL